MLKLQKIYKSETALEILQEAILSGNIQSGTEITQNEAAQSLGVSRMPVREAFIILEYCGLVERLPGQHVRVSSFDDEIIKNIFSDFSLLALETIKNFKPEDFKTISRCENQNEFHEILIAKTKSQFRKKFFEIMKEIYLPFVMKFSENQAKIHESFKNLLSALKNSSEFETAYKNYSDSFANELIKIRKRKKKKEEN
ncbi:MAG: GntR family transcriptional regulator [Synergistaceae bacterium]|nr:GntR family transcriptional regulator [Synergistaceae bacterium]